MPFLYFFIPSFLLFSLFLFSSHFPIISSHFFLFFFFLFALSLLLFRALTVWVKRRKFPPPLPQAKFVWLSVFLPLFLIFFISFMTSYPTWLNMSHGIMPPMWLNVSHSFYAKCHTLEVPCGILLPCHVSSNTPRLEKREIPTTSESNEI